jgi:hypothetical protein
MMRDTVICLERFDGRFSRSIYDYYFFDYWFRSLWYWIDFRDNLQQQVLRFNCGNNVHFYKQENCIFDASIFVSHNCIINNKHVHTPQPKNLQKIQL